VLHLSTTSYVEQKRKIIWIFYLKAPVVVLGVVVAIDTLMSKSSGSLQMLRVHIAPVGFEVDRIVIPAIQMKADRIWLITHDKPKEDEGSKAVKLREPSLCL
jgi:hypothetical protein